MKALNTISVFVRNQVRNQALYKLYWDDSRGPQVYKIEGQVNNQVYNQVKKRIWDQIWTQIEETI